MLGISRVQSGRRLMRVTSLGRLQLAASGDVLGPGERISVPYHLNDSMWHFVRLSWLPSQQRIALHVDGWEDGHPLGYLSGAHAIALLPDIDASSAETFFGEQLQVGSSTLSGMLDEVRILIGEDQVAQQPLAALGGSEPGLLVYLRFEELPLTQKSLVNHAVGSDAQRSILVSIIGDASAASSSRDSDISYRTQPGGVVTLALHTTELHQTTTSAGVITSLPLHGLITIDGTDVRSVPFKFWHNSTVVFTATNRCLPLPIADSFKYSILRDVSPHTSTVSINIQASEHLCAKAPKAWNATVRYSRSSAITVQLPAENAATCLVRTLPERGTLFMSSLLYGVDHKLAAIHATDVMMPGCSVIFEAAPVDDNAEAFGPQSFEFRACAAITGANGACIGNYTDARVYLEDSAVENNARVLLGSPRGTMITRVKADDALNNIEAPLKGKGTVQMSVLISEIPESRIHVLSWGSALKLALSSGRPELSIADQVVVRASKEHTVFENVWMVITVSWDGLTGRVMVNGKEVAVVAVPDLRSLSADTVTVWSSFKGILSEVRVWHALPYDGTPENRAAQLMPGFLDSPLRFMQAARSNVSVWKGSDIIAGAPVIDSAITKASKSILIDLSVTALNSSISPSVYITTLPTWGHLQLHDGTILDAVPAILWHGEVWYVPGNFTHSCDVCAVEASFKYGGGIATPGSVHILSVAIFRVLVEPVHAAPQLLSASGHISARMNQMTGLSIEVVASNGIPEILLERQPAHGFLEPKQPHCTRLSQISNRLPGMCGHVWYWPNVNYYGVDSISAQADDGYQLSGIAEIIISVEPDQAVLVSNTKELQNLFHSSLGSIMGSPEFTIELWIHIESALRHYTIVSSAQGKQRKVYVNGRYSASTNDLLSAALADAAMGTASLTYFNDVYIDEVLGWTIVRTEDDISEDMSMSWDSLTPMNAKLPVIEQFFSSSLTPTASNMIVHNPVVGVSGTALDMAGSSLVLACSEALRDSFTIGLYVQFHHEPQPNSELLTRQGVFTLGWDAQGLLAFAVGWNTLADTGAARTSVILNDGAWHYVMGSYHQESVRLYVDGHFMDLAWTSGTEALVNCTDTVVHSFNGSLSAVAVHNTSLHGIFAITSPHQVLYNYIGLHTAELWLLNEGTGWALQRTIEAGAKAGNGTIQGTPKWVVPQVLEAEQTYIKPGDKVCIPLQVADMGSESQLIITAVPTAGFVFEADPSCRTWLSRVLPGQMITGRHLVYAAPVYPEEAKVGNLTYVAFNGKGHSRPMTLTLQVEPSTPQCRYAKSL
jgi:hypothetical protein